MEVSYSAKVPLTDGLTLKHVVQDIEMRFIVAALDISGGNQSKAAKLLGMHRTTFIMKRKALKNEVSKEGSPRV